MDKNEEKKDELVFSQRYNHVQWEHKSVERGDIFQTYTMAHVVVLN